MSAGRVCVVTGGNAGIGEATVAGLLTDPSVAQVHMVCRDATRGEAAAQRIEKRSGRRPSLWLADLALPREVARISRELNAALPRIDSLVLNAAVVTHGREVTSDAVERQLAVNHLAYFVMARELLPALARSARARIVVVASNAHFRGRLRLDDFNAERSYSARARYAETKLMNVLFAAELARRLGASDTSGVTVNSLHPGVIGTGLLLNYSPLGAILKPFILPLVGKPERGAETSLFLATSDGVANQTGKFFRNKKPATPSAAARDEDLAKALWARTEALVDKLLAS